MISKKLENFVVASTYLPPFGLRFSWRFLALAGAYAMGAVLRNHSYPHPLFERSPTVVG